MKKHISSPLGRLGAVFAVSTILLSTPAAWAGVTAIGVTNVSNGSTRQIYSPGLGALLPIGTGVAGVGYFKTFTDAAISALSGGTLTTVDVGLLAGDFELFGSTTPMTDFASSGLPGLYSISTGEDLGPGNVFTDPSLRPDNNVGPEPTSSYTFIGNALDFASSTEIMIMRHSGDLDFTPDPSAGPSAINPSTDWSLNSAEDGMGSMDAILLLGTERPEGSAVLAGFAFELEPAMAVPEPSRAILLMLGLVGVMARRRR